VAVYNRTVSKVDDFLAKEARAPRSSGALHRGTGRRAQAAPPGHADGAERQAVDEFIELLLPHLAPGDIIIDGGNSNYNDTIRRTALVESKGSCTSAPASRAARRAPAPARPSCPADRPRLAARQTHLPGHRRQGHASGRGQDPCCDWVGENGAGHYVKMVHNGIEYGDMQLICEAYD